MGSGKWAGRQTGCSWKMIEIIGETVSYGNGGRDGGREVSGGHGGGRDGFDGEWRG